MAIVACKECNASISSQARSCPQCGAKVPHFKWWLWVPLGLVVAFIGFGMSIPEYARQARAERELCLKISPAYQHSACWRVYDAQIAAGKASR